MKGGCNHEFVGGKGREQSISIKICWIDAWDYKKISKKTHAKFQVIIDALTIITYIPNI